MVPGGKKTPWGTKFKISKSVSPLTPVHLHYMSHIWMNHDCMRHVSHPYISTTWVTYEFNMTVCVMFHLYDSLTCDTTHFVLSTTPLKIHRWEMTHRVVTFTTHSEIHRWDMTHKVMAFMTHSNVTQDSFICDTGLVKSCFLLPNLKFTHETWLIQSCLPLPWKFKDETRLIQSWPSRLIPKFTDETWLIKVMTFKDSFKNSARHHSLRHDFMSHVSCVNSKLGSRKHAFTSHVSHMNESCVTYERNMCHIWITHVSHMDESCVTYGWVMCHIWMSHVSHMNQSCVTYEWVMTVVTLWVMSHMRIFCEQIRE